MTTILRLFAAVMIAMAAVASTSPAALAAVKATVNGEQITDVQIAQRLKLFQLEGRSGTNAARDELVDEALMLQEAKRLNLNVTEGQIDQAYQNVARNLKVSVDNLDRILQQNGVNPQTLRDRLKATLAWNEVIAVMVMPRIQISDVELEQRASEQLDPRMSYDYILKEVLFVGKGNASARTNEANRYRQGFKGCDSAVQLSLAYTDAAVIDVGRRHATQLPEAIASELSNLNVGGLTKPRVMENGVSMLAICAKSAAEDTTFIKSTLRAEAGNEQIKGAQADYLKEVRERSRIIYE